MSIFFDDMDDMNPPHRNPLKPFHTIQKEKEEEILDWLNESSNFLLTQNSSRHLKMRNHLAAYRGRESLEPSTQSRSEDRTNKLRRRRQRLIMNHLHDLTETKVSQLTRVKPAIQVIPVTDDYNDKQSAKTVKKLYDHLSSINDIDSMITQMHRVRKIAGESYMFITWDKDKGDKHPDAGKSTEDAEGNTVEVPEDLKTGDVCLELEHPWRVLVDSANYEFKNADYCTRLKVRHVETVRAENPNINKEKIIADVDLKTFDAFQVKNRILNDHVVVYEFFHRKTKLVPEGRYIRFTKSTILEDTELPYSHGELPFVRFTDLDIPDVFHGISLYEQLVPIQNFYNNMSSMIGKNIWLTSHAKWMMPRGAARLDDLGNDNTVVQFQGPVAPFLAQASPNPTDVYNFRGQVKEELEQLSKVDGTSRGQPPQGITAAVALRFLNEQENERNSTDIAKHNKGVQSIARLAISVAGDFYEPDDGRMLRILGKDNRYMVKFFDTADLTKDYDIRVESSTPLAESKSSRLQRIIETAQFKPDLLSPERWIELLELGQDEKMSTLITEAIRNAESENEDILNGDEVSEPAEHENHILHWRTHVKQMQARSFREEVPIERREAFRNHLEGTEFLMFEKAKENPLFEAKLAELDLFPIYYKPGQPIKSREHQTMEAQGAFNRGDQTSAVVPALEPETFPDEQKGVKK
jgi:hypothetical protein